MDYSVGKDRSKKLGVDDAEETLRLIVSLPAPQGLEDRLHISLRADARRGQVFAWPVPLHRGSGWMRSVAAAAIVCVVAGGGWGIYSRVMPGQTVQAIAGQGIAGAKSFSTGEARRRPQTLTGPMVPQPVAAKAAPAAAVTSIASKPVAKHLRTAPVSDTGKPTPVTPVQ